MTTRYTQFHNFKIPMKTPPPNNQILIYQCPECGFHYREKEWADKCDAWCKEHKSCNLEIIAHAEENRNIGRAVGVAQ